MHAILSGLLAVPPVLLVRLVLSLSPGLAPGLLKDPSPAVAMVALPVVMELGSGLLTLAALEEAMVPLAAVPPLLMLSMDLALLSDPGAGAATETREATLTLMLPDGEDIYTSNVLSISCERMSR